MEPKPTYIANLDELSMYKSVILNAWSYKVKRTTAEKYAIQKRWNERLKMRLHKEVADCGVNGSSRKM